MLTEITKENFTEFTSSNNLSIVKVSADWCGPCKVLKPIIEDVSNKQTDVMFGSIDADDQNSLAKDLGVRSIPTTIFYRSGQELKRRVGSFGQSDLENMIEETKNIKIN